MYLFLEVLQQLISGPVTTATNERSFSALRYLETYLRFTTKKRSFEWIGIVVCSP